MAVTRMTAKELFAEAQQIAEPEARAAYVVAACGEDTALRRRVGLLLQSAEKAGTFLERPPTALHEIAEGDGLAQDLLDQSGERIGRYRLLEKIGEGGCGVIYMAEQEDPIRRRVALKIIKLGMDTRAVVARFEVERQALALMDHPNIAKVLDGGATPSGRPYFVMELVRGLRFTDFCVERDLPVEARLRLFLQVCHAVQHAHQKGVIHRDLKPSNILVTVNDGVPMPKVIDFGIAKAMGQRLTDKTLFTQFLSFIGTPAYVSPEQAEMSSVDIDTRSDIYSLGVLLYELLTGRTPFDGVELMRSGLEVMRRTIREEQPPKPSSRLTQLAAERGKNSLGSDSERSRPFTHELVEKVRGDLDWIVMKCLEKDRARRYATANGLAADVQRHLDHEPILARPPSGWYRFCKLVRRHRVSFAAIAAVTVVLLAGVVVSTWQAIRAQRGEALAKRALAELRATAPAFSAQAREFVSKGLFSEAIEKLNYAIQLRPDRAEYRLQKGNLQEAQLRFSEAAATYRSTVDLGAGQSGAVRNLRLCDRLRSCKERSNDWYVALGELYALMTVEGRSDSEFQKISELVLQYAKKRLGFLPFTGGKTLENSLTIRPGKLIELDLREMSLTDLTPLRGLPIGSLDLAGGKATDLIPLAGLPIEQLNISGPQTTDLRTLPDLPALRDLSIASSGVTDLGPLRGRNLRWLDLAATAVSDLSPLRGMNLSSLRMNYCPVVDLSPLAGMALKELECAGVPASDLSPLATCTRLKQLFVSGTGVKTLEALRQLPLMYFRCDDTAVSDLAPLAGLPLVSVRLNGTKVTDLRPLAQCPTLRSVVLPPFARDLESMRELPNLKRISYSNDSDGEPNLSAEEFWKMSDLERSPK